MTGETHRMGLDRETQSFRYYRNAVERHWDADTIDLSTDRERVADMDPNVFDQFRSAVARFGAGEQAVTDDLAPLAAVLERPEDQLFITTQLYEEARHAEFFDRYWQTVIRPAEEDRGMAVSSPADDRWFDDAYDELFDRNTNAQERLLTDDTPENRAKALCHYHLVVEGILAQTGYYGLQWAYGPDEPELPTLPGFVEGLSKIRGDEGRHVGFGMAKLKALVADGVDPKLLHDTVNELVPLVTETTTRGLDDMGEGEPFPGPPADAIREYATEKHLERMSQITDASEEVPDVEELTNLDAVGE
jgi:ribonucleoside-diphosphate reductase beta chain